jgi:hypothetical protein
MKNNVEQMRSLMEAVANPAKKYKNQDPNRPPDKIDRRRKSKQHYGENLWYAKHWYDTDGKYHRDGDLPAVVRNDSRGTEMWYQHGQCQRDNDKPAIVNAYGKQEWTQDGQIHRETGPAVINADGTVEFWLNDQQYSIEEWAEKVGMSAIDLHDMKEKYGL